ncbi:GntR family transcriptional regulator [Stutzerimonas tarimensis]|uniref:GntR family transcriptional regulator n=1 Tax=Stutzerimonas tarimensis TaxID=1507735 RepID=A0ABV7T8H5_9GAMM
MSLSKSSPDPSDSQRPLAETIGQKLSDEILAGQIQPGTRLDEVLLARRFGVSRTPVREALRALSVTGLVAHRHRRGVFVEAIPEERLAEMFEYAAEMEALCAYMAALRMTPEQRETLLALHRASYEHIHRENIEAYASANVALHEAICHGCNNRYLIDAALAARARVVPYRRAQFRIAGRLPDSFAEHDALVKALLDGRAQEASQMVRSHLRTSHRMSLRYMAAARRAASA